MDTVIALVLMIMVGMLLLLGLIGLAIGLGYVNVTTTLIVRDVEQEEARQIHLQGERTRRAMDRETRRYLDDLYEDDLTAIEADYQRAPEDGSENVVKFQDFGSMRQKGRMS